jgi:hypothetical protein
MRVELGDEVPRALYRAVLTPGGRARARWRALWTGGLGEWRRTRRLHGLCAELAFKRMQRRRRPDEPGIGQEIERLRGEVSALAERGD